MNNRIPAIQCDEFRDLLDREAAGDGTAAEFERLEQHREGCDACAVRRSAADPLAMFANLAERQPSSWPGLWEGIRDEVETTPGWSRLHPAYGLAAAAALVLALGLGALLGTGSLQTPGRWDAPVFVELPLASAPTVATVEHIVSPSARIYDMQVIDAENRVTELVMIFDEGIDL